ncbi:DUF1330 domain-containing protein [Paraburkholderia terricola]|uniref:DUF1330 domain-containing protein n=1 Tax=Paraburkholderia terricola TaxID=169427 RepID=UPI002864E09C|nr:DUF1330 domain-containing protein [Paraburkholderia terricola]MDR6483013.1 uncharacterized protein (DUF1330 family) [Paraburkholderia terricola]
MTAYLIADVDVTNPAVFEEYKREVPATEARYGGKYLGPWRTDENSRRRLAAASSRHHRVSGHGFVDGVV